MSIRRIVVTGMGAVTPLGCGVETVWQRLLAGRSGLRRLADDVVADLQAKVGGVVPSYLEDADGGFNPDLTVPVKEQKKMDRFILFALAAAKEALAQAGWVAETPEAQECTATIIAPALVVFRPSLKQCGSPIPKGHAVCHHSPFPLFWSTWRLGMCRSIMVLKAR